MVAEGMETIAQPVDAAGPGQCAQPLRLSEGRIEISGM